MCVIFLYYIITVATKHFLYSLEDKVMILGVITIHDDQLSLHKDQIFFGFGFLIINVGSSRFDQKENQAEDVHNKF